MQVRMLFFGIIISTLLTSCSKKHYQATQENKLEQKANPISDPNQFIGKHKAKVMVLGVFHFHNPGLDGYKPKHPFDIFENKRQGELAVLLEQIAKYKPTKILVEWNRIKDDSVANDRYQKYLKGTYSIDDKSNEVYQIGFKLAKKLGHERIYCSEATAEWFGVEMDWENYDVEAYLK